jgi:hypothetical protein
MKHSTITESSLATDVQVPVPVAAQNQPTAYVGIDVGDRQSRFCMLAAGSGEVLREGRLPTTERGLERLLGRLDPVCVAIEVGTHSAWMARYIRKLGHQVLVANYCSGKCDGLALIFREVLAAGKRSAAQHERGARASAGEGRRRDRVSMQGGLRSGASCALLPAWTSYSGIEDARSAATMSASSAG